VFAPFLFIIFLLLSFFCQKFLRHISWRCLDQTLWNLVGISYAMWSCAFKGWFFQNGCRCHGNGQNALKKNMKNTKMIIAGYSMKGIQIYFKSPLFVSMATAAKFVQPIPIFFGLSRSTRCGCCSYQVSSISVWRVTCYDHFCVFHIFF
jgi:hypothetical protein